MRRGSLHGSRVISRPNEVDGLPRTDTDEHGDARECRTGAADAAAAPHLQAYLIQAWRQSFTNFARIKAQLTGPRCTDVRGLRQHPHFPEPAGHPTGGSMGKGTWRWAATIDRWEAGTKLRRYRVGGARVQRLGTHQTKHKSPEPLERSHRGLSRAPRRAWTTVSGVSSLLNTGGVSLNPQEIRNSTWPGPLNDLLLDLSEDSRTRRMLRISRPQASALWKEMRDVELILRFFTFKDDWDTFSGGMAKRLDLYMSSKQRPGDVFLQGNRREFMSALSVCEAAFGEFAFRRYQPERSAWRTPILASLYDAQMFAAQSFTEDEVKGHRKTLLAGYKDLFDDTDFRKSIDAATNTPALFRARIEAVQALFNRTIQR